MSELLGVIGAMLSLGTPLVIAATGETISERAGVLNIGLEGAMLASAYAGFLANREPVPRPARRLPRGGARAGGNRAAGAAPRR